MLLLWTVQNGICLLAATVAIDFAAYTSMSYFYFCRMLSC